MSTPYRTEAPPLPERPVYRLPWWEEHGSKVFGFSLIVILIVLITLLDRRDERQREQARAARIEEFRSHTDGCTLTERAHGEGATVLYECPDGRRERFPLAWVIEAESHE